jgi:hypothetical protein
LRLAQDRFISRVDEGARGVRLPAELLAAPFQCRAIPWFRSISIRWAILLVSRSTVLAAGGWAKHR